MQKITTIMLFMFGLSMMSFSSNPSLEKLDLPIKYPLVTIFC
jgi:hypothetical protein